MSKRVLLAAAAVTLSGCGGYFDQHPANVRPESEAVAAALGNPPQVAVAEAETPVVAAEPPRAIAPWRPVEEARLPPPAAPPVITERRLPSPTIMAEAPPPPP